MSQEHNWGYHIRLLREQKKLSRAELAKAVGISYKGLEKIENGRQKNLSPEQVAGLSKALGLTRVQILDILYGLEALPNQVPLFQKFPYEIGDEPMTFINLPAVTSKNARGFVVPGSYLEPQFHDGDYLFVDDSLPLDAGDAVACLVDGKMQYAKLRKVANELWLEGKGFKIKYQDSQYVYKIIGQYINWLHNASMAIVAGLVGMLGLLAGVVQLLD